MSTQESYALHRSDLLEREALDAIMDESDPRMLNALGGMFKNSTNLLAMYASTLILSNIEKYQLSSCVHTILAMSDHDAGKVRCRALETLGKLGTKLRPREDIVYAIVAKLGDECSEVREMAIMSLMQPAFKLCVGMHMFTIVARLRDQSSSVRHRTLEFMSGLEPRELVPFLDSIVGTLVEPVYRHQALQLLQRQEPAALARHVQTFATLLMDRTCEGWVRMDALKVLRGTRPEVLRPHVDAIATMLIGTHESVCYEALVVLRVLEPRVLAPHVEAIAARLQCLTRYSHHFEGVLREVMAVLNKLPMSILVQCRLKLRQRHMTKKLLGKTMWYICRKLFWANWMLLWWNALVWVPGGRQSSDHVREMPGLFPRLVHKRARNS